MRIHQRPPKQLSREETGGTTPPSPGAAHLRRRRFAPRRCFLPLVAALACLWAANARAFVVISEIMYHPPKNQNKLEFVELYNDSPTTYELSGWKFSAGLEFTFPPRTNLPAHGYLAVCSDPETIRRTHKIDNVAGPFRGELSNAGALIELRNAAGGLIDRVDYQDAAPWPAGADGTGHTLSLTDPTLPRDRGESWALSRETGGTPGRANFPRPPRRPRVLINEVLFDSARETWIELYNPTTATVELAGYGLTDEADRLSKFTIPSSTTIAPRGFRTFTQKQLGFALSSKRRKVFLATPRHAVLNAVACRKTLPEHSFGRRPDGAADWYRMPHPTADAANTVTLNQDVVINEIMYHPFSERVEDEYVELYNRGRAPADLSGWAFTHGVEFEFAPGTMLPPDGYLAVCKDRRKIAGEYGIANCVGDFRKHLGQGGERLVLCDRLGNVADEVAYSDGGRWPVWADGGGSSLELIDPRQDNAAPAAWAASDETSKSQWTRIEYKKPNRGGRPQFELFLLDKGIALLDDLELRDARRNYIVNGTFDKNLDRWQLGGTHKYSSRHTADSHGGGACLRVQAVGGGQPGVNGIREATSGTLQTTATYTVSYWAKWQTGCNLLLTRTHNGGVDQTTALPVPDRLGTPGRRNSRWRENLGPVIAELKHVPVTPTTGTAVTVTARISDADGVASATAYSRRDGVAAWTATPLLDDGRRGDGAAGDGLFGAVLPGQTSVSLVEFFVRAADRRGAAQSFPPNAPWRTALYRVRGTSVTVTTLKSFDLLMTSATAMRLYLRSLGDERMDNEYLDATLVLNDSRAFYNAGARHLGSYWTRPSRGSLFFFSPSTRRPAFRVQLNADDKLFGYKAVNFDSQFVDFTLMQEAMYYWFAQRVGRIPWNAREYVLLAQNGRRSGVVEFVQPLDRRFIEDYFAHASAGDFYEINDSFEWTGGKAASAHAALRYLGPDKERYRFNFEKHTHQKQDDFTSLIELCSVFDPSETDDKHFEQAVEATIDVDQWLRYIASLAVTSDWDGLGFLTGKNTYLYRPPDAGRWIAIPWDKDLTWRNSTMAVIMPNRAGVARMLGWPRYKRLYYSRIEELLRGPFQRREIDPVADPIYRLLVAEGEKPADTKAIKNFVDARRKYLEEKVLPKAPKFAITTRSGKDFATTATAVTLEGVAPLCAREFELNRKPAPLQWTDAATWRLSDLPLKPGENRFAFVARPMPDGAVSSCTLTVTRR